MTKRSETSLGNMQGLKSYEPDKGWSDISDSEVEQKKEDKQFFDDSEFGEWKIEDKESELKVSGQKLSESEEFQNSKSSNNIK